MERNEASELVQYLIEMASAGFTIVTWNGLGFDYDILSEESGLSAECKQLALEQVDMMFQVFCIKGFPVGLDNAARGSGIPGKVAGMSGVKAPSLWQQGRHQEVLDYVAQDVRTTLQVACVCDQRRSLTWVTRKGSLSQCSLPLGWLAVRDALRLPEPDTSWMDTPMSRSNYTAWLSDISQSLTSRSTRPDGPGEKDIDHTQDLTQPAHQGGLASSVDITEIGLKTDTSANAESNRRVSLTKIQRATEDGAELLSLCQTVTADGALSDEEVQSLRDWLRSNSSSDLTAISFLFQVVEKIVADGIVTSDERHELFLAVERVLPQDVREMSRTARRAREQAGKEQKKLEAEQAKRMKREERERD
ncbi:MAG: ribonuclease H-like domain-containing protein, partial [Nitrospiraceae bacterium]